MIGTQGEAKHLGERRGSSTLVGPAVPNIPWEDRPGGSNDVVWRSTRNPIIPRDLISCANSIFNSAVVPFEGGFAGVFRVDPRTRKMQLHRGRSVDGEQWDIDVSSAMVIGSV